MIARRSRTTRGMVLAAITLGLVSVAAPAASASIRLKVVSFDPSGEDTTANINEEYVVVRNTGT